MGRIAAPTALKVVRGDPPHRVNQHEPKPDDTRCPTAPTSLDPRAKAIWRRLAPSLHKAGILTVWDRESFAAYCAAVIVAREAAALLTENGALVVDAKGHGVKNPAFQVWREATQTLIRAAQEFGLTPVARGQLKLQPETTDEDARRLLS